MAAFTRTAVFGVSVSITGPNRASLAGIEARKRRLPVEELTFSVLPRISLGLRDRRSKGNAWSKSRFQSQRHRHRPNQLHGARNDGRATQPAHDDRGRAALDVAALVHAAPSPSTAPRHHAFRAANCLVVRRPANLFSARPTPLRSRADRRPRLPCGRRRRAARPPFHRVFFSHLFKVHRGESNVGWLGVRITARRSVSRDIGRVSIVNLRPRNGSESGPAQRRFVREHVHMSHQVRRAARQSGDQRRPDNEVCT